MLQQGEAQRTHMSSYAISPRMSLPAIILLWATRRKSKIFAAPLAPKAIDGIFANKPMVLKRTHASESQRHLL
jgi:hypothetical protein